MEKEELFAEFKSRLGSLNEEVRESALSYAADFYSSGKISKAEAIEKGITRAEIEKRDL